MRENLIRIDGIEDEMFIDFSERVDAFYYNEEYSKLNTDIFHNDTHFDLKERLTEGAYKMLTKKHRKNTVLSRKSIIYLFERNNLPIFEKLIELQQLYGGMSYEIETRYANGRIRDGYDIHPIFSYNGKHTLNDYVKKGDLHLFGCMNEHYSAGWGLYIDNLGRILEYGFGHMIMRAESMEDFIELQFIEAEEFKTTANNM